MSWSQGKGAVACSIALVAVMSISIFLPLSRAMGEEDAEVVLRFALEEGKVLKYRGSTTSEANWQGMQFTNVHSDDIEMSFLENLEEGNQRVEIKYLDCSDKRSMGGSAFQDFDSPVKPKGRSVKVVISPRGDVVEAAGFILGVKKGKELDGYVNKWFTELPENAVGKDSEWTIELPKDEEDEAETSDDASGTEDADESEVRGPVHYTLKKFEKKDGINVAVIESKAELSVHTVTPRGVIGGVLKVEGEFKIAVDGGYIVELKSSSEMKGELVSEDEFSGKETRNDVIQVRHTEIKLEN